MCKLYIYKDNWKEIGRIDSLGGQLSIENLDIEYSELEKYSGTVRYVEKDGSPDSLEDTVSEIDIEYISIDMGET